MGCLPPTSHLGTENTASGVPTYVPVERPYEQSYGHVGDESEFSQRLDPNNRLEGSPKQNLNKKSL